MEEETKKPCTPVEEAGGDYNELGLYLHSKENNQTLEAAQTLWEFLPGWMAARKMAVYDPDYNRSLSGVIAECRNHSESSSRHGRMGSGRVRTGQEGRNSTGISPCRNI